MVSTWITLQFTVTHLQGSSWIKLLVSVVIWTLQLQQIDAGLLLELSLLQLGEIVQRFGVRRYQYADDTPFHLSYSRNSGEAVDVLKHCLPATLGWMRANELKLN